MANLTITVPDELKNEMESIPEANWSEVCRRAITEYVARRKSPNPDLEVTLRDAAGTLFRGTPCLMLSIIIVNRMDADVTVDRILVETDFVYRGVLPVGGGFDLHIYAVSPKQGVSVNLPIPMDRGRILELDSALDGTFQLQAAITVFLREYRTPFKVQQYTKIPIDEWKNFAARAKPG